MEKQEIRTRNVTVRISTMSKTNTETQHIDIDIIDNKTNVILKSFDVMESDELKRVWVADSTTLKEF